MNYQLSTILAIFFFSTNELVGKLIDSQISPIAITAYRFLIGGLLISLFTLTRPQKQDLKPQNTDLRPQTSDPHSFISYLLSLVSTPLIGILNVCISMYTLQLGVYYGQAGLSAIIISCNPIFVGFFARFILGEPLRLKQLIYLIVGLLGLALIIVAHDFTLDNVKNLYLGVGYSLVASITFGLYTVLSKRQIRKSDNLTFNSISFIAGAIVLILFGLLTHQDMSLTTDIAALGGLLYMGVFVTGLAYILFFWGLSKINTATGSSFFLLKPIFASVLAYFFLSETLSLLQIFGVIIVITALFLQNYKQTKG